MQYIALSGFHGSHKLGGLVSSFELRVAFVVEFFAVRREIIIADVLLFGSQAQVVG